LSLAASVGSGGRALVVHYLQNTYTHTTSQRTSPKSALCRVLERPGSVGVGYAGMSQMQTLVTRLGAEVAGYGRIDAIHFSGAPGAGGSQCAYGERTQEQAARSAGVRRPKVTVSRVVSGQPPSVCGGRAAV
jgi:hypothetical protein